MRAEAALVTNAVESREVRIDRVRAMMRGLVMSLVQDMDAVEVIPIRTDGRVLLRLDVAEQDRGQVIGRKGRTARSLRQILGVAAARNGLECDLEIVQ